MRRYMAMASMVVFSAPLCFADCDNIRFAPTGLFHSYSCTNVGGGLVDITVIKEDTDFPAVLEVFVSNNQPIRNVMIENRDGVELVHVIIEGETAGGPASSRTCHDFWVPRRAGHAGS